MIDLSLNSFLLSPSESTKEKTNCYKKRDIFVVKAAEVPITKLAPFFVWLERNRTDCDLVAGEWWTALFLSRRIERQAASRKRRRRNDRNRSVGKHT